MQMERRLVDDHATNLCQWRIVHCRYCNEKHVKYDEEVKTIQYNAVHKFVRVLDNPCKLVIQLLYNTMEP